jgi:hypothetical protein
MPKVFKTWVELNDFLRKADEKSVKHALDAERHGSRRRAFLMRIHAKLNKLRGLREREELHEECK